MIPDKWTELEKLAKAATLLYAPGRQTICVECGFDFRGHRHRYGCETGAAARDYNVEVRENPQTILRLIALARSEAVLREAMRQIDARRNVPGSLQEVWHLSFGALAESDKLRGGGG